MYKVLLVDDEPIIRKGLKNIIHWEQFDCEICGEASDGLEGLEMIRACKPDIIFTDIRMPEMSGLEMISEAEGIVDDAQVIILTGFRDFEYAKEAIILNVFDFLLKPTKLDDIARVLKRVVKKLQVIQNASLMMKELKAEYEKSIPKLREKLLYDVMMGITMDEHEVRARCKHLGVEFDGFFMILAGSYSDESSHDHLVQYGILHAFEEMLSDEYSLLSVAINDKDSVYIIRKDDDMDMEMFYTRCTELQRMIEKSFGMNLYIAVSGDGRGLDDILRCYSQCKRAYDYKDIFGQDAFVLYSDICNMISNYTDARLQGIGQLIVDAISNGSVSTVASCVNELIAEIKKRDTIDEHVAPLLNNIIMSIQDIKQVEYATKGDASIDELLSDIKQISSQAVLAVANMGQSKMKLLLQKAIEFLNTNYQRQITLQEVSDAVYVSPYYISRMFTRETGKTMTEYLNGIRLKNACKLLEDIEYKVYQVGEMVGIPDAHYFSRLFKKTMGVTPSEYRNKMQV